MLLERSVLDHEAYQARGVDQDDAGRSHPMEGDDEGSGRFAPHRVAIGVAFGLNIDPVEAERILVDHAISAARAARRRHSPFRGKA